MAWLLANSDGCRVIKGGFLCVDNHPSHVGVIVFGAVLGAGLLLLIVALFWRSRHRRDDLVAPLDE